MGMGATATSTSSATMGDLPATAPGGLVATAGVDGNTFDIGAWSGLMADAMVHESSGHCSEAEGNCGTPLAVAYFISFQVIGTFVFLNLVVAVILENFTSVGAGNPDLVSTQDLERFKEAWAMFDPDADFFMPAADLPRLMLMLPPAPPLADRALPLGVEDGATPGDAGVGGCNPAAKGLEARPEGGERRCTRQISAPVVASSTTWHVSCAMHKQLSRQTSASAVSASPIRA